MNLRSLIATAHLNTFHDIGEIRLVNMASPMTGKEAGVIRPLRSFCCESNGTQPEESESFSEARLVRPRIEGGASAKPCGEDRSLFRSLRTLFVQASPLRFVPCQNKIASEKGTGGFLLDKLWLTLDWNRVVLL